MKWLVFFFLIFFYFLSFAQEKTAKDGELGVITGTVVDDRTKEPVPYATVTLKAPNATVITGTITNNQGEFSLTQIPAGSYLLDIYFLGYQTQKQTVIVTPAQKKINLGKWQLLPEVAHLKELVVTGEKPAVTLQVDKKVYEVGKDILAQSGSVNEVLNNVPSVTVSPSGVVSLRGNSNVLILINNRRSGLTLSNALDQIPADQIERVEVITNPSARYDAAGSAGIINLILKKNKKAGFSGQVRLVSGLPLDARINPGFNFKSSKLNIFANIGYRQTDYVGFYQSNQTTLTNKIPTTLNRKQNEARHDDGKLLYVGADYYLNAHHALTAAFFKNATRDSDQTTLNYQYQSLLPQPDSLLRRLGSSQEIRDYNQLEFNFTKTYPTAGQKLTADVQYDFWNSDKSWNLATHKLYPTVLDLPLLRTNSVGSSKDFLIRTDYVKPFNPTATLELGLKVETRVVTSSYKAEELADNAWQIIDGIDNKLNYQEKIGSAYGQYSKNFKKLDYMLGLRSEITRVESQDRENTFTNQKNYQRVFPTVNLKYAFKETATLQGSYSKRINRPNLSLLYPFNDITDFNAQFVGNPDLNPAYTDAFELNYLHHGNLFTFNPSVYYQHSSNLVQFYTYQNQAAVFITTPFNLEKEQRYGLELALTYNPFKWLQINGEVNWYAFRQRGKYQEQDFAFADHTQNTRLNTQLKLPHQFTVQSRFNYTGAQNNAQSKTRALYYVDAGLSKNLLQNKIALVLDGSNLFNSRQTRTLTTGENYTFYQLSNYNAARYRFSFVYRFNKKEDQSERQAKSGNRS